MLSKTKTCKFILVVLILYFEIKVCFEEVIFVISRDKSSPQKSVSNDEKLKNLKEQNISSLVKQDDNLAINKKKLALNGNDSETSSVYSKVIISDKNLTESKNESQEATESSNGVFNCPKYINKKGSKKEIEDFMKYTYNSAIDLCNTSSRVGCKSSDFLRQISNCVNSKYFDLIDASDELNENKKIREIPRDTEEPVFGYVILKVLSIDAISVKDMDFKMDFYLGVAWEVKNSFFRKYMTRICLAKKVDMEKKKKLILYQEDLKLFWLPDLYFTNSKNNQEDEKNYLKRPRSRDYLEVSFEIDKNKNPFLRFIFVTSGHSNLLCPMQFDDYPSDVQKCVAKIRSFFYYQNELKLNWYTLLQEDIKLLEYSVNISKGEDIEEDHFIVEIGNQDSMLFFDNFRSSIGIMVLLTLTIMFSKVRSELPGSSNLSGMEIWLIFCFICDLIQLIEASIVELIYTNHCIDFYLRKKSKRELETEYLGYSYSMLFDDTSDEDEDHFEEECLNEQGNNSLMTSFSKFLIGLLIYLILPNFSKSRPEFWSTLVDKLFRFLIPISTFLFGVWYWMFLL